MMARMDQKAGSSEAIIRYRFGSTTVMIGHGALVDVVVQPARTIALEKARPFDTLWDRRPPRCYRQVSAEGFGMELWGSNRFALGSSVRLLKRLNGIV